MHVSDQRRQARTRAGVGRRAEILDVAAKVFARTGFVASTVREIGEEAGILSGSLYHHFESKDAMLEEILRPFTAMLVHTYTAIATSDLAPSVQMRELIRTAYQVVADMPEVVTILQNESGFLRTQPRYAFVTDGDRDIRARWIEVIERGQTEGVFRSELDSRMVYRAIMGAALAAVRWFHPRDQADVDTLVAHQTQLFLGGLESPTAER